MDAHLDEEVTSLATCWRIIRTDGVEYYFTDHDANISFGGNTYVASSGYQRTAIQNDATLSVDNLEIQGILDSNQISDSDLRVGKFDYAEIRIFAVNWQDLTQNEIKLRRGWIGEVMLTSQGTFAAELRGMTQSLSQQIGQITESECRADLGDTRCTVPINPAIRQNSTAYAVGDFIRVATAAGSTQSAYENRIYECTIAGVTDSSPPAYDTTVGNTTADGTATFTARQAWMRHGVVDTVTSRKEFTLDVAFDEVRAVDDWFNGGALEFEDGDNDGKIIEIRDWVTSTLTVTLFLATPYDIAPGALVRLYPGCNKRLSTCVVKFVIPSSTDFSNGNVINFRGEPFLPGIDQLIRTPDAQ